MAALIKNMLQHSMETVEEDVLEAQDREQGREERLRTTRQEEVGTLLLLCLYILTHEYIYYVLV